MSNTHASSVFSINKGEKPSVATMISGANSSAAAKSSNKDGEAFFETSKTITDKDGTTHTTKTSGKRGANGDKDLEPASKNENEDKANGDDEADEIDGGKGISARAGSAFATAGGAIAGVKDGKAVASAT